MAISRNTKESQVSELVELLQNAKLTAAAQYAGLTVTELQELRKAARENNVTIKVVKNRLLRVAMTQVDTYKNADASNFTGQLLYAISADDEVMPAKILDEFAKDHTQMQLIGGLSNEGNVLSQDEIKALAGLPGKNDLIAQTIAQLLSPVHDVTNALSGNLHALLDGVEAKATA